MLTLFKLYLSAVCSPQPAKQKRKRNFCMKVQEQPATDSPKPCLSEAVCVMNAAVPKSNDEPDSTTLC